MKSSSYLAGVLLLASIVAFFAFRWFSEDSERPLVVVSRTVIEPGATITAEQLRSIPWSEKQLPAGIVSDEKALVGRVAKQQIIAGEPLFESKLASVDARGGLSSVITPGKRAITVRVNDVVGVAGFALPGSYVDIIVNSRDDAGRAFSKVVLDRVKVLAVAQETATDPTKPKIVNAVTLELTPRESEQLDLARSVGSLSLVLRNELDQTPSAGSSSGARIGDLITKGSGGGASKEAGQVNRAPSSSVQELRGTVQKQENQ